MNQIEIENRIKYLREQVISKKYTLEKAVIDFESICKELLDLEIKLESFNVENKDRIS